MNKFSKSQIFNLAAAVITIIGMVVTSKAQESELEEMKEELRLEMKQGGKK